MAIRVPYEVIEKNVEDYMDLVENKKETIHILIDGIPRVEIRPIIKKNASRNNLLISNLYDADKEN